MTVGDLKRDETGNLAVGFAAGCTNVGSSYMTITTPDESFNHSKFPVNARAFMMNEHNITVFDDLFVLAGSSLMKLAQCYEVIV